MKTLIFLAIVLVVLAVIAAAFAPAKGLGAPPKRRRLLTDREQAMFNRLKQALPTTNVLAQVSFGALLTAKQRATRNRFDRKIADFVVCDQAYQVLAVIELDDASHRSKVTADKARDLLLTQAGYRVLRYPNVPDIDKVQLDIFPPPPQPLKATT